MTEQSELLVHFNSFWAPFQHHVDPSSLTLAHVLLPPLSPPSILHCKCTRNTALYTLSSAAPSCCSGSGFKLKETSVKVTDRQTQTAQSEQLLQRPGAKTVTSAANRPMNHSIHQLDLFSSLFSKISNVVQRQNKNTIMFTSGLHND